MPIGALPAAYLDGDTPPAAEINAMVANIKGVVAATSEVTVPYTGMIVFNTADNMLYRWSGTAWIGFLACGGTTAATRHEARYEQRSSAQSVTNAVDFKLKFETVVDTTNDVTASGTNNTDFLLSRIGRWRVAAGVRFLAGTTGERHIFVNTGTTITSTTTRLVGTSTPGVSYPVSLSVATDFTIAAATSVHVGVYQNNGGGLSLDVAFGGTIHLALTWLRP